MLDLSTPPTPHAGYEDLVESILAPLRAKALALGILDETDDLDNTPLPPAEIAKCDYRPSRGRKRALPTYYRRMAEPGGLEYVQVGGSRRVTLRALAEYYARKTLAARGEPLPEAEGSRSPAARSRAVARANREAEALRV